MSLLHPHIPQIVAHYTEEVWYQYFLSLCGNEVPKKIILVSDFINKVGGIETYLHDVKALLEERGHTVHLRGGHLPKGIRGTLKMWF
jgi:hypothetical protein